MPVRDLLSAASGIGAADDPNFNQVSLLLNGDGTNGAQNNTFLDSSTNNFTITRNGNTTQGSFSPYGSNWSNYFDGTDDYLSIADNAVLRPGAGAFTLEAWIYRNASGTAHTIYAKGGASTGISFLVTSGNVLRFTHTTTNIDSSGTVAANSWVHVAVVREGTGTNQTKLYINGVQDGQGTVSTDFTQTEESRIGTNRGATDDFAGYISNLRFVKGSALYVAGFTPSTTPLTTTSQGASSSEVELLTCQSNRFVDNSTNAFALTITGSTSVQRFSPFNPTAPYDTSVIGGSGYFDGSGDYLASGITAIGTGDFTIEYYSYLTAHSGANGETGYFQLSTNSNGLSTTYTSGVFISRANAGGGRLLNLNINNNTIGSTYVPPLNEWFHTAIVRQSGTVRMYINGVLVVTPTANSDNLTASYVGLGGYYSTSYLMTGYLSGFRIVNSAVYTAAFTPPTAPPTPITSTGFLANYTNAGIPDLAMQNNLETVGNAQVSTSVKKYGTGSLAFDGSGDWLTTIDTPNLQLGTGNFTIEGWVYLNAIGSARGLVSKGTSTTGWSLETNALNQVVFNYASSSITSTGVLVVSTWYFITIVREGTGTNQTKIYIDGTNDGTGTVSTDFNQTNIMYVGADRVGGSALSGYIDDLRITKGLARYTANFTPPASALPTF